MTLESQIFKARSSCKGLVKSVVNLQVRRAKHNYLTPTRARTKMLDEAQAPKCKARSSCVILMWKSKTNQWDVGIEVSSLAGNSNLTFFGCARNHPRAMPKLWHFFAVQQNKTKFFCEKRSTLLRASSGNHGTFSSFVPHLPYPCVKQAIFQICLHTVRIKELFQLSFGVYFGKQKSRILI